MTPGSPARTVALTDPATVAPVLDRTLRTGRDVDYEGYSKHDALNSPLLERLAGSSRLRRLAATQVVTRSPVDLRPLLRVRTARNAKGLSLFARALLARHRLTGAPNDAAQAAMLLDWLCEHPSPPAAGADALLGPSWGYPYPWQDVGFFAPRDLPNRVVTSFVGHALLDGFATLGRQRYLDAARGATEFLLRAPRTLYEDADRRCVSYVPDEQIEWIVMDVSALSGALVARVGAITGDRATIDEGARLVRYVVSKQTPGGAWFYADPPSDSHLGHDNYHTGFILDALLVHHQATGSDEFEDARRRGLTFYATRLFEPDGAPRYTSDRRWPVDIHGCAQGIITFSLSQAHDGEGGDLADRVLAWTLGTMWDPRTGWFAYQKRRLFRTHIRELRWCQGWMSWALACYLETGSRAA
jgi:hypothetical protein